MAWIVVATIGGSLLSANAAGNAARAGETAAKDSNAVQLQMFNQQRDDQQPWRQAGQNALGQMQDPSFNKDFSMEDFQKDPGYQFRMDEGMKAINNAASARGMGNSGATMKALAKYGQDYSSGEYGNVYNRFNADKDRRFNRLSSLAGLGQTANSQVGQAGMNFANQYGQNLMSGANASAAGTMGMANAVNGGIGSMMNYNLMSQMIPKKAG